MTPPITPPMIAPLVLVDDLALMDSLVTEFDAKSVFVVTCTVDIVVNPAVMDVSAEGHEFLPSSAITMSYYYYYDN